MLIYSIYGLAIRSNIPIPGLAVVNDSARWDIQIQFGPPPEFLRQACVNAQIWHVRYDEGDDALPSRVIYEILNGEYFWLRYADGTEFVFDRHCTRLWADWPMELTLEDTAMYLLGPVLGLLFYLRGLTCLHASAVAIGNSAIALVGESGAGKSTTAAAFAHLNYRVLAEDVVTLDERNGKFLVHPAYPYIRLWPSSVELLYGTPDALPLLTPTWDKHCLHLLERGHPFSSESLPLAAVYLLGERSSVANAPFVEAVAPSEGLIRLVTNTYAASLLDKQGRAREFALLGRLTQQLPVRRVIPHEDPAQLFNLCQVIADDARNLTSSPQNLSATSSA